MIIYKIEKQTTCSARGFEACDHQHLHIFKTSAQMTQDLEKLCEALACYRLNETHRW